MPNVQLLIKEALSVIKTGFCCRADLELDCCIKYDEILGMWNFHKLIVRPDYAPIINSSLDVVRIFGKYYNRHSIIKDTFTAHTNTDIDHVIMFVLKDSDQVLLCYKSIRRLKKKINPYIRIFLPKKNVDLKVFNIEYIPNKIIKILYFSKKLNN